MTVIQTHRCMLADLLSNGGLFIDGDWVESKDQDPAGDIRLIQLADVGDGVYVNKSARFLTSQKAGELKCTFLERGDILVARMPDPLGRACLFPGDDRPCVTVVDVCIVRPDSTSADRRWLLHAINSPTFRQQVEQHTKGTTRQRISRTNLGTIEIEVPPLPEQRRIADILDKADAIRRKRKEAIALTEELLRSAFLEMFGDPVANPRGWPVKPFKDLLTTPLRNGLSPASGGKHFARVLTLSAITGRAYQNSASKEAAFAVEPWDDVRVDQLDFLICRGNGNKNLVGKGVFPTQTDASLVFPDTMIAARVDTTVVAPEFLAKYWESDRIRRQLESVARTTNGTFKINQAAVEGMEVVLPPRRLQTEFQQLSQHTARMIIRLHDALAESDKLFDALVAREFQHGVSEASR